MINITRAFLLLLLIVPTALHADAITMRASVRMRANGEPLRLKDIEQKLMPMRDAATDTRSSGWGATSA